MIPCCSPSSLSQGCDPPPAAVSLSLPPMLGLGTLRAILYAATAHVCCHVTDAGCAMPAARESRAVGERPEWSGCACPAAFESSTMPSLCIQQRMQRPAAERAAEHAGVIGALIEKESLAQQTSL